MKVKAIVVGLPLCLAATAAYAQATKGKITHRPKPKVEQAQGDTATMTCADARKAVTTKNAVVLRTGANIFDLYVSSARYCGIEDHVHPAMVRAKDTPLCYVGYTCQDNDSSGGESGGGESE